MHHVSCILRSSFAINEFTIDDRSLPFRFYVSSPIPLTSFLPSGPLLHLSRPPRPLTPLQRPPPLPRKIVIIHDPLLRPDTATQHHGAKLDEELELWGEGPVNRVRVDAGQGDVREEGDGAELWLL